MELTRLHSDFRKAPFPYFGGKRSVADEVWRRFGNVPNYVEPFAGSLAVLLARPHESKTETVNDLDCYLSNFWRAVQADPEAVARWADYPVSEVDLESRHYWLVTTGRDAISRALIDPDYYDAKVAGWWMWGACSWIGTGWCDGAGGWRIDDGDWINGDAGRGINRKLPHLGDAGRGAYIRQYMAALSDRLRDVRIACGDWSRVLGPSVTHRHGHTAVFLDPPYGEGAMEYSAGGNKTGIMQDVAAWAVEQGANPLMRIALCGYEGTVDMPADWNVYRWKNRGGYGSQGDGEGRENAARECIWFSPHCLGHQASLFDIAA